MSSLTTQETVSRLMASFDLAMMRDKATPDTDTSDSIMSEAETPTIPSSTAFDIQYSSTIAAAKSLVENVLEFSYETVVRENSRDETVIKFNGSSNICNYKFAIEIGKNPGALVFYSLIPLKVPVGARRCVATYLLMASYSLRIGSFEMDMEDGEVRFKVATRLSGQSAVTRDNLTSIFLLSYQALDRYLPGIIVRVVCRASIDCSSHTDTSLWQRIVYAKMDPKEAFQAAHEALEAEESSPEQ